MRDIEINRLILNQINNPAMNDISGCVCLLYYFLFSKIFNFLFGKKTRDFWWICDQMMIGRVAPPENGWTVGGHGNDK